MKKEIFDFSEALRRMKEGKKVKRRIGVVEQHLLIRRKFTSDVYPLMIYGRRIVWTFLLFACRALMVTFSQMTGRRCKDELYK